MKVLFIYPNLSAQIGFNYGVAFLSAVLKEDNHTTALLNINEKLGYSLDLQRIINDVKAFAPDLIAFSVVTNQFQYTLKIAEEIKKHFAIPLICGGIHPTMVPEDVLSTGLFEAVFIGEAEMAMKAFVLALEKNGDFSAIPNIWYRFDGEIRKNKIGPFTPLENLPPKDYEIFDFQKMIDTKHGWVGLMTSRGCPFSCSYCFNHQIVNLYKAQLGVPAAKLNYIRHHSIRDVINEIVFLQKHYHNIRMYIFDDDIFTLHRGYLKEFCQAYRQVTSIPFVVNAHVQVFDEEMAHCLKEAGCAIVKFGIESGSEKIRKQIMRRIMKNDVIKKAFTFAHDAGLHTSAFVMFGLPYESKAHIMDTIKLLAEIQPGRFRWATFFPYPKTEAYEMSKKGRFIDFDKMERLNNFTEESCLDFGPEQNLLLKKLQKIFPWYVNAYAALPGSSHYRSLVERMESLSEEQWSAIEGNILTVDHETSAMLTSSGQDHYAIKYNPFMAVRSDWQEGN
jgi:radical SAM superfamily enzyme YgiQ (UPF0313 family)